ncbi:ROK family protein [Mesorhizobium sp. M2D.F.Ca.ET.185.01.1.1]|uniref:ROK family protein n=1 Tax=unclassified Mesorhizobium TaxID=325217 RepID=UPI000FCAC13A|nr:MULTISPECIES: ROK family protein [unclassified Mesorhizobium]TGP75798.1 ROK family protein [bacterium M00.F.Ca.ET.227.01.1.1]TGP87279.1 ROK family protein [bacterium M00.F.Ca.ET.221.01.1.1]TGP91771.1 ROK family protein [bacterium M00.F.Ca.ET.222.01.1.1]TGU05344.1 ROK family protein [bacterium M00.F.Ca.ET.163.01.1.1]TGU18666.1 ROK family protein [bacterium M00.F.Ca.ET.156.01.1.1]TGU44532.1 ROK family protein [bacterium M00.F.Ca.ET.146.01.1.1]TGV67908.1 ROK family protein [Mesorhizobium sp.
MAKAAKKAAASGDPIVLTIDVGGSHVKILTSAGGEMRRVASGPSLTPDQVVGSVKKLAEGLDYDVISMGYPGPVRDNKPSLDPFNLGKGWNGYDFTAAFGKPVKLVNDALMQAIGSYDGGRMLFLGLGTGLGAAMIIKNVGQPMELAHLPYKKGATFEDYVGERGLVKHGKKKWRKYVFDVVGRLRAALQPDYVVIGGGNVDKLDELPEKSRRGDNTRAFEGGFRLWRDKALIV